MTAESKTPGTIAPLPVWAYWLCVALCAGLPVVYVAGVVPAPYDALLAAINAALGALIGVTRPAPTAEREALAAARKATLPPPSTLATLALALAFLTASAAGCSFAVPPPEDQIVEVGATNPEWSAEDCHFYDSAQAGFTAAGEALVGVGAAAPVVLAAWPEPTRDETIAIGTAGAISTAVGAVFVGVGHEFGWRFVERCTDRLWYDEVDGGTAVPGP